MWGLLVRYLRLDDKRSRASILYEEAHRTGNTREQLREKLRRAVREILTFYIFSVIALFYLDKPGVAEDNTIVSALLLAAIVGPICWLVYRVIRFALAR
jgi:uncharacterized protein (DUF486 family)